MRCGNLIGNYNRMKNQSIQITGARQHNLKNLDLAIPLNQITVVTGVSGSGNGSYDPNVEGSGVDGSTGFYQLEVTFGAAGRADFITFDEPGDSNLHREQYHLSLLSNHRAMPSKEHNPLLRTPLLSVSVLCY